MYLINWFNDALNKDIGSCAFFIGPSYAFVPISLLRASSHCVENGGRLAGDRMHYASSVRSQALCQKERDRYRI